MAAKKQKKGGKVTAAVKKVDAELRKAFDKFRKDFAGLVGEVARIDADMKKGVEVAKTAKGTVSKLMKDPLVSVPQQLERRVVDLEAKLNKMKVQIADRALATSLDAVEKKVADLEKEMENCATTVAAHDDRLDDLDDAITAPKEHANPPDHPAPDPRQTNIEDAIEKEKARESGQMVGGLKESPTDEGARPLVQS